VHYAGVELGGTKCVAILARGLDDVVARTSVPTTAADETLRSIEQILRDWKSEYGIDALGIASFGPVDVSPQSKTFGQMLATPKPGWAGADVLSRLQQAAGVPASLDTDVNGAAFAEMRWGSGRGFEDFAYVTVGTGIGVGLIVHGKPTGGFSHCELGHARFARRPGDDWAGSCPFHGDCVEGIASGSALSSRFGDALPGLGDDHPVWDEVGWALAQLCHTIVCAAAPQRIAMGGGVMEGRPHLIGKVNSLLAKSLNGYLQLPGGGYYVVPPELGPDAGPLGAIALAMDALIA
jgi:fructokinase